MKRQVRQQLKGAFPGCPWCDGFGCLACDEERRKAQERMAKPIFSADRNDPADMAALRRIVGAEAMEHAFGPGGGGMREVEHNAAVESLLQFLRKAQPNEVTPQCDASVPVTEPSDT